MVEKEVIVWTESVFFPCVALTTTIMCTPSCAILCVGRLGVGRKECDNLCLVNGMVRGCDRRDGCSRTICIFSSHREPPPSALFFSLG